MKLVHGVGVYEKGVHAGRIGSKQTRPYNLWVNMLKRCYSEVSFTNQPTYTGCTVSENFKHFQYFAEWCQGQVGFSTGGYQLDKDLLVKGNKIYSEHTCIFVPKDLNVLLNKNGAIRGGNPLGVSFDTQSGKYKASIRISGKKKTIGLYSSPEEAFVGYKHTKEATVQQMVNKWKDQIDPRAYTALMNYQVEITD